jgi:peptidyl-prolyl cis-trans isomerase C
MPGIAFAEDAVLATFGDTKITVSDLNKIIGYFDKDKQKLIEQNPQVKENLVRQLVQSILISDMAKKAEYEKKADIKERLTFFTDSFLANEYLKREVVNNITISDDDIKSYYDSHKEELRTPEMVRARHILVMVEANAPEEEKQKAKEKAEDIMKKVRSGEDFEKLASELSDDTLTKQKGGDLGFFTRGRMLKPFEDAAFALKPGEVSEIVETPFGYHIIKVDEKKDASVENYDAVKDTIEQRLLQERTISEISKFTDKVLKDAGVEFHLESLAESKK